MRKRTGAGMAVFLAMCLAGCARKAGSDQVILTETEPVVIITEAEPVVLEEETVEETEPEPEFYEPWERPEKDGMVRSYLTGEMVPAEQGKRRPLAIMMSNDKESLPQYGINRAGVVYEAPVEGAMNRYMAIMENYDDLDRIGSVRSCRTYYTYFAREFDAIYAHCGQSTFARPYLKNVDNINGVESIGNTAYYRTSDRKRPHNFYASFEGIQKAIETLGYSQEYDEEYRGHYYFAGENHPVILDGEGTFSGVLITPGYPFSKPWFAYNEEDKLYHRFQYSGEHRGSEGQIAVKNIIIQCCASGYYATTDYRNINVHEDLGGGFFITNGRAERISWKKDGEFGVTHYYGPDGKEIVLNPGKTWVCIVLSSQMDKIEIQ